MTAGCTQWVVSSTVPAPICWLKSKKGEQKSGQPTRVVGSVAPTYVQEGCQADNWGRTFLLLVAIGLPVYVIGGALHGARGGRGGGGGGGGVAKLQAHPHYRQWTELQGLCQDGLRFVRSRGARGRGPRSSGPGGAGPDSGGGYAEAPQGLGGGGGKSERSKEKRNKKEKRSSESRKKEGKGSKATRQAEDAGIDVAADAATVRTQGGGVASPAAAAAGGAGAGSKETSSAGGGRWVHVPE